MSFLLPTFLLAAYVLTKKKKKDLRVAKKFKTLIFYKASIFTNSNTSDSLKQKDDINSAAQNLPIIY